jgi:putative restriction endonuclease
MAKVVLITKVNPTYDDLPEERYHFPRTYLNAIQQAVGDWAIYYEPRRTSAELSSRGGRMAYFATARITHVEPDSSTPDHFYAYVTDFLEFERYVPFREGEHYYESALRRSDGGTSKGMFGRAVRPIPDQEYDLILRAGFATLLPHSNEAPTRGIAPGLEEEPSVFERPIIERVVARPFRDAAFSRLVKSAYGDTCAITGLKIINGGGRSEVQAAHIRPVASKGPDSVRNGLALSGTIHWMFDRGLISIDDDYSILTAQGRVPDTLERLIRPERCIATPSQAEFRPHPQFLKFHRDHVFKG